jgi:hypothetical protein
MKALIILTTLLVFGFSVIGDEFPEVFKTEGTHSAADGRLAIDAVFNGESPKCIVTAKSETGKTTLGLPNLISVSEGWFFYVESEDRVWFYDGTTKLILWQFAFKHAGVYDLQGARWLKSQVPSRLANMLPKETQDQIL